MDRTDTNPGLIGRFFDRLGSFLEASRRWAANLLFLLIVGFLVLSLTRGCSQTSLPSKAALLLVPEGVVVDQTSPTDPLQGLLRGNSGLVETELAPMVRAVDAAANDDNIKMLVLRLDELAWISTAHANTLGAAIARFQAAGKSVTSYGYAFGQPQYLLASFADAVYLHPLGEMILSGQAKYSLYYKELIDKLKINMHIFRVGTYKSFVEPYERNDMSDADRQASQELLNGLWQAYAEQVATNRKLEPEQVQQFLHDIEALVSATNGDLARAALESQLIDELLTEDQARVRIGDAVGFLDDGNLNTVGYQDYLARVLPKPEQQSTPYISVITASGQIVMRDGLPGTMAADSLSRLIRQAKQDKNSAALVLRIDSPGGSAFASELIRQELELYQLSGRPVVTSMGNTAASGGYWIASTSDHIVAQPTTITGSIGIFGLLPTFENTLAMAGVRGDGVAVGPLQGGGSPYQSLSQPLANVIQRSVEQGYERFINLVARGREMPVEAVQAIAEGRVWMGSKALELGLVDSSGGVAEAVAEAKRLTEQEDLGVRYLRKTLSPRQQLLQMLFDNTGLSTAAQQYRAARAPAGRLLWQLNTDLQSWLAGFDDPGHRYVLCSSCAGYSR